MSQHNSLKVFELHCTEASCIKDLGVSDVCHTSAEPLICPPRRVNFVEQFGDAIAKTGVRL